VTTATFSSNRGSSNRGSSNRGSSNAFMSLTLP
jgi:hypothetical protein